MGRHSSGPSRLNLLAPDRARREGLHQVGAISVVAGVQGRLVTRRIRFRRIPRRGSSDGGLARPDVGSG